MCSLLPRVNGTGETAWLRYNAASRAAPSALPHGEVTFGDSVCLHKDRAASDADSLKDDGFVSLTPNGTHILCTGSDLRVPVSVLCSAVRFAEQEGLSLHVFCVESHPLLRLCPETATVYTTLAAQREALSRQLREGQNRAVNVFLEMSAEKEFTQPLGTLRPSADAALLKNAIAHSRLSVVFERRCKIVRSELPQLLALAPIHITAVGDSENLRTALPDTARITATAFDVPKRTASTRITVIGIRKDGVRSCCFSPFPLVKDIFSNLLEVSQKADTCPLKPRFPKKSLHVRLTNRERLFIIRDSKETNVREALICRTEPSVPCINAQANLGWGYFYDSVSL